MVPRYAKVSSTRAVRVIHLHIPCGHVLVVESPVRDHLFQRPEGELCVVRGQADRPTIRVTVGEIVVLNLFDEHNVAIGEQQHIRFGAQHTPDVPCLCIALSIQYAFAQKVVVLASGYQISVSCSNTPSSSR